MRLIDADGSYTINASDNTDYSLCFGGGIISVIDKHGHIACEFFSDDAPTIDAEPVVHGRWIAKENPNWKAYEHDSCSICGWWNTRNAKCYERRKGHSLNFCPNCGAKMDEEDE